jgi:hypothetical protein
VDFANVVNQGEQFRLDIYLRLCAQGEVIQSFLNADMGKHRLDNPQAKVIQAGSELLEP